MRDRMAHRTAATLAAFGLLLMGCPDGNADSHAQQAGETASSQSASKGTMTKQGKQGKKGESVAIDSIDGFIEQQGIDTSAAGWKTRLPEPPKAEFGGETIYWDLTTNVGDIRIKLMPDVAPMHVTSTIYLTRLGFYDDVVFHRVINGFMAQGGDPTGTGRGGPGYKYDGEFDAKVKHDKPGLLSMANAGPGTDGSQFFITFVPTPHLDGKHTIFGEVVDGMDTVRKLEENGSRSGRTKQNLMIEKATITVE